MDEIRIEAQERFDLVEMTRLLSYLQDAFGDIFGNVLGNYLQFTGAAADASKRPSVVCNFKLEYTPSTCDITVRRTWTDGGINYKALVYDKDGRRITGPNSATSKIYTASPTPSGTRYLIVRRVATDDTPETRRFYSESSGKYTGTIDTRTIDDWEIGDSSTDPDSDAAKAAAGWVRIGVFTSDGTYVTSVTASVASWAGGSLVSWSTPGGFPVLTPQNLLGVIASMYTVMSYMRDGFTLQDPRYDACFDREGGVRFAKGKTEVAGVQNVYERLTPKTTPDTLKLQKGSPSDADDLHYYRAGGFVAGGATGSGAPDTTNRRGFCYAQNLNVTDDSGLVAVDKWWTVPAASYFPTFKTGDPTYTPWKNLGLSNPFIWLCDSEADTAPLRSVWWAVYMKTTDSGYYPSNWLHIPVQVPHLCKFVAAYINYDLLVAIPNGVSITIQVLRRKQDGSEELKLFDHQFIYSESWPTPPAWSYFSLLIPEAYQTVDNELYAYSIRIRQEIQLDAIDTYYFEIGDTAIQTVIREASHVY